MSADPAPVHRFVASSPRGFGDLLAQELRALGAAEVRERALGVEFSGPLTVAYRACLESRVAARVFLVPLIQTLLGEVKAASVAETAVLTQPLEANGPRLHLMRAKLGRREDGALTVAPLSSQDSSLLNALAGADCLILRQPGARAAASGDAVEVERLS